MGYILYIGNIKIQTSLDYSNKITEEYYEKVLVEYYGIGKDYSIELLSKIDKYLEEDFFNASDFQFIVASIYTREKTNIRSSVCFYIKNNEVFYNENSITENGWTLEVPAHGVNYVTTGSIKLISPQDIVRFVELEKIPCEQYSYDYIMFKFIWAHKVLMEASHYNSFKEYDNRSSTKKQIIKPKTEVKGKTQKPKVDIPVEEFNLDSKLDSLIGLQKVKDEVRSLINLTKIRKLRRERGLPFSPSTLHLVFKGNPGTGKTEVARIIAAIYMEIGLLEKGHLVEVDRAGLVGQFVGHTAEKVKEVVENSIGGVLFIDEAYSLAKGGEKDFGQEAIDALVKSMEDNRENLVVIAAGYPNEMDNFLSMNPGLNSRFPTTIIFEDYSLSELFQIFSRFANLSGYELEVNSDVLVRTLIKFVAKELDKTFGNGRCVRNIFDKVVRNQIDRVAKISNPSNEDLTAITNIDVVNTIKQYLNSFGYEIKIGKPDLFTEKEKDEFYNLLINQQKVTPSKTRINGCNLLGIIYSKGKAVSIGAIKNPNYNAFDKANVDLNKKKIKYELGYLFTEANFEKKSLSSILSCLLLKEIFYKPTYATTESIENNSALKLLLNLGFKKFGKNYPSEINDGIDLCLMIF